MDLDLRGRRALVTGGGRGIGKAIARQLADEGADVAVVARTVDALEETAEELAASSGRQVIAVPADTGSDDQVSAMVANVVDRFGGVDILVNAAAKPGGGGSPPKLADITDEAFFDDINVKVLGYLRCAREVVPQMRANGWGRIINISGLAARSTGSMIGSIRNVGVSAMTKNLADELRGTGINVTVVHPGLTWTERIPALIEDRARARGVTTDEVRAEMDGRNLVGRMISADDIADVVAFLASPRSVAINGDAVVAGGGAPGPIHY